MKDQVLRLDSGFKVHRIHFFSFQELERSTLSARAEKLQKQYDDALQVRSIVSDLQIFLKCYDLT